MAVCEYCTLQDFRTTYKGATTTQTAQYTLILQTIRQVSREMEKGSRWFFPQILTHHEDRPGGRQLDLDNHDWLEITTVTNGDGTVEDPSTYDILPEFGPPYFAVRFKLTSGRIWLVDRQGNSELAEQITGVCGFVRDYDFSWQPQTSVTGVLTASTTALTGLTAGEIHAGQLLKLGSGNDYAYVTAAVTEPGTTSATLLRGVNGSTAVSHGASDPIFVWSPGYDLEMLCKQAVQAHLQIKDNPTGERVVIPGVGTFSTPKDINAWIAAQLFGLGYSKAY